MTVFVALLLITQTFHEHAVLEGHNSIVSGVSFSFDSELLATGSSDSTVKIWDVASARERSTLEGHGAAIRSVRFSSKGTSLTSVDYRGKIILWDRIDGVYKSSRSHVLEGVEGIFNFDQQQFGKLAFFSSTDKVKKANIPYWNLNILNTENGENIIAMKHNHSITSIAISPDGSFVSFGDDQGVIKVLSYNNGGNLVEVNTFTCPLSQDGDPAIPMAIAIHPQMKFLAFGCDDNKIRLWRWSDPTPFATLEGHTKWVDHIAISTDGDFIVSGSHDMTLRVWSTKTKETLKSIQTTSYVCSISISNNNKYFAYGDYNKIAHIWEIDKKR
jgi:WD40 repeat protein